MNGQVFDPQTTRQKKREKNRFEPDV